MKSQSPTLILFNYDWDAVGFERACQGKAEAIPEHAGFDLFSFPSNAHLAWFDIERFVNRLAKKAKAKGWTAVVSHHEQFGALAAAMLAEKMGHQQFDGLPRPVSQRRPDAGAAGTTEGGTRICR